MKAFNAQAVPPQFQDGSRRDAQAGEKEVPLEGGLAGTHGAFYYLGYPTAAGSGSGNGLGILFAPECSDGVAPVTAL